GSPNLRTGGSRLRRHRRGAGRSVGVVPPPAPRARPRGPGRRRGPGRGVAAPLGLADHGRRARGGRPAGRHGAGPWPRAGERGDPGVVRGVRACARPAGPPAGAGRPRRECRRPARRPCRVPVVDDSHRRERHRHMATPLRAALPGTGDVQRGAAAHRRLPRARALPRQADPGGRWWRERRPVPRRAAAGHRHGLGDAQRAGVAGPRRGVRRARGDRAGRGTCPEGVATELGRVRHRLGPPAAGAGGGPARRLRPPPDVRPDRAARRPLGRRLLRARRRHPVGHRLPAGGEPPRTVAVEERVRRDPAAHLHPRRAERHHRRGRPAGAAGRLRPLGQHDRRQPGRSRRSARGRPVRARDDPLLRARL
ncbi:MAG: Putative oxidoreductase, partial [uncultured Nocardioidaceae bacterium]